MERTAACEPAVRDLKISNYLCTEQPYRAIGTELTTKKNITPYLNTIRCQCKPSGCGKRRTIAFQISCNASTQ